MGEPHQQLGQYGQLCPMRTPQSSRETTPTLQVNVWSLITIVTIFILYSLMSPFLHFQHLRGIWPLDLFHKGSPHIYQRLHPYSIMGYWQSIMPWVPQPGGGGGLPGCLRATSPTCSPYQGNPPDSGRSGGSQNNGQSVLSVSVC